MASTANSKLTGTLAVTRTVTKTVALTVRATMTGTETLTTFVFLLEPIADRDDRCPEIFDRN